MSQSGSLFGGILLVVGTCIGGGMLALPVITSLSGFLPSMVMYLLCWAFMAATGLLMLEVCQWMKDESNLVSMAEKTLGAPGKFVAWGVYLFLFYCLTIAYVAGTGNMMTLFFGQALAGWKGSFVFILLFAPFVYSGARIVGPLNTLLMVGLGGTYIAFLVMGYPYVNPENLKHSNWLLSGIALPVAFTSFAYQGIIPTLSNYMGRDFKKTRTAILVGSFLPFVAYMIWEWLILGIVPTYGPDGLAVALQQGENAIQPLKNFIQNPAVFAVGQWFAFFALTTSFFGVTLGLLDFLSDGLKIEKTASGKLFLCCLIFLPPLFIASVNPNIFLTALDYAGGFGCAILLGLLPILMVWRGRYHLGFDSNKILPGGRIVLALLTAFVVIELGVELFNIFVR